MRKCPKRKEGRGRRRQRLRARDRSGKIIAALRTGGDAPIDARRRYAVRDDGLTRLTSGDIIRWVMPVSGNGYESDLSRRAPGGNRNGQCSNQKAQDHERSFHCVLPRGKSAGQISVFNPPVESRSGTKS